MSRAPPAPRQNLQELEQNEKQLAIPIRPGVGSLGKPIKLTVNVFKVPAYPTGDLIHYNIEFRPAIVSPKVRKNVFQEALEQHRSELGGVLVAYDGHENAYCPRPLPSDTLIFPVLPRSKVSSEQQEGDQPQRKPDDREPRTVTIKRVEVIKMANLTDFLTGKISWTPYEAIHALEVVLKCAPSSIAINFGRSYFLDRPEMISKISSGAEVWSGYFLSMRPCKEGLVLNCDTAATAFYQPLNLVNFAAECVRQSSVARLGNRDIESIEEQLHNVMIKVTHRAGLRKKFKIICLTKASARNIVFETPEGKVSVAQYFSDRYKHQLRFPEMPCVQVAPAEKKIFLPMEVCEIVAGQKYMRKLSEDQTVDMIKITCKKPMERLAKINSARRDLALDSSAALASFGVRIGTEALEVNGRVLPAPSLTYGTGGRDQSQQPSMGAWNLMDKSFSQAQQINSYAVVSFASRVSDRDVDNFVRELSGCASSLGMRFNSAKQSPLVCDSGNNIDGALSKAIDSAAKTFGSAPQIIFVLLPSTSAALYGEIKRVAETRLSVMTQCLLGKHLQRVSRPFCANLLMKVNVKLGGVNWNLGSKLSLLVDKPTIVFGADVTHPGIGETGKPSIAAVVASCDLKATRFVSAVSPQDSRMELIADLKGMVKAHLKSFYSGTQRKPERIVFYRDGVSEGQFAQLIQHEVSAIKNACQEIEAGYAPALSFIVVQKRHHVRFFPKDPSSADRSGNVPPGTVVDSGMVHPTQFDFYLCSHSGIQGTSRPTHYHVLHDDNRVGADSLQELTYHLCYVFARCTRSVSLVPAAYYAHLVAFRARFFFDERSRGERQFLPISTNLAKSMYFV